MRLFFLIISLFVWTNIFSQKINYRHIRYSVYLLPCGAPDSASVWASIHNLEALDTTKITKHINEYYTDLGICYWLVSGGKKGEKYRKLALKTDSGALYHNPKDTKALWNASIDYFSIGDCEKGKYYMTLYKKYTPKRFVDEQDEIEINNMIAKCEK
jgi:hypothetical protein